MAEQSKSRQQEKTKQTESNQANGGTMVSHRPRPMARQGGSGLNRLRDVFDRFFGGWSTMWNEVGRDWRWGVDINENEHSVIVSAEAPGFEAKDFHIQISGNTLTMRASRHADTQEKEQGYREWRQQEMYETVSLPTAVDADKVEAQYRNGVLTVTLPKTEESRGRRIEVKE